MDAAAFAAAAPESFEPVVRERAVAGAGRRVWNLQHPWHDKHAAQQTAMRSKATRYHIEAMDWKVQMWKGRGVCWLVCVLLVTLPSCRCGCQAAALPTCCHSKACTGSSQLLMPQCCSACCLGVRDCTVSTDECYCIGLDQTLCSLELL